MCSQGFNRYPNDILKLSFSYAWGVISVWKWYLWKGVLGSPEKSGILTLLHCSCPHDICMCHCESILARMCPVPTVLYHFLPILLRRDLSLKPGTPVFLVSLDASQLQRPSRGSPPGIRVTGVYRMLSLLCGCWHLDSGPHRCSSSTCNHSLAFAWHSKHGLNVMWLSGWRLSVTSTLTHKLCTLKMCDSEFVPWVRSLLALWRPEQHTFPLPQPLNRHFN